LTFQPYFLSAGVVSYHITEEEEEEDGLNQGTCSDGRVIKLRFLSPCPVKSITIDKWKERETEREREREREREKEHEMPLAEIKMTTIRTLTSTSSNGQSLHFNL
jgi:hypothetical protein